MKILYAHIQNFKKIEDEWIHFVPKYLDTPPTLHALLGDNGSGKTTILQAIALTLSLATRRVFNTLHFPWNGFLAERLSSKGATRVELSVSFESDEIMAIHEAFDQYKAHGFPLTNTERPTAESEVTLVYENKHVDSINPRGLWQFRGRYYAKQLLAVEPAAGKLLSRIGDVFWYDQFRNISTVGLDEQTGKRRKARSWKSGVDELRENLVGWWAYHKSEPKDPGRDYIPQIEQWFAQLFPGTRFQGVAPMPNATGKGASDFYFLLEREGKTFDIAEMSSGEQSLFPLVCDFVRSAIHRSVVLIDELELHLHPPEQQTLLAYLPRLGSDCQFIISTHSESISRALTNDQTTRLQGGRLCL